MKKLMYSVRDDVAEVFQQPFCSINDSTAKRDYIDGVAESPHKNDLTLYALGDYNDATGVITVFATPKRIMTGFEVKTETVQPTDYPLAENE